MRNKASFLLIIFIILEIIALIIIGSSIGSILTILWFIFTVILGVKLIRLVPNKLSSLRADHNFSSFLFSNGFNNLFMKLGTIFIGILLVIPGFITDFLGLALLLFRVLKSFSNQEKFHNKKQDDQIFDLKAGKDYQNID